MFFDVFHCNGVHLKEFSVLDTSLSMWESFVERALVFTCAVPFDVDDIGG